MIFGFTSPEKIETAVEFIVWMSVDELARLTPQEVVDILCEKFMNEIMPKLKNVMEKK